MMKQQHVFTQIPDYVLGLLPTSEQLQVERHTRTCPDCSLALQQESGIGPLVRSSLAAASQPPANLRQFMPRIAPKPSLWQKVGFSLSWQRQLAPLTLILLLFIGSLAFNLLEGRDAWTNPLPTALAVTATLTDEPTATLTETRAEQTMKAVQTAVSTIPSHPDSTATPAPNPTPIAALAPQITAN